MKEGFDLITGKIDLSKVDPTFVVAKENLMEYNLKAQKQTNEAIISLFESQMQDREIHAPAFLKTTYVFQSGKKMGTAQDVSKFLKTADENDTKHFKVYGNQWLEDNKEQLDVMGFYNKLSNIIGDKE